MVPIGAMSVVYDTYFLKFCTDALLLPPATMGLVFTVSRTWDAISDPLIGYSSDRTPRGPLGRRRPWLLCAAPPMALFFIACFAPPALTPAWLGAWVTIATIGMYTALTAFHVPHYALAVHLTGTLGQHERTRLFGYRQATGRSHRVAVGSLAAATILLSAPFIYEHDPPAAAPSASRPSLLAVCRQLLTSPAARLVTIAIFLQDGSKSVFALLAPYMLEYVAGLPSAHVPVVLAAYLTAHVFGLPPWVAIGERYGKVRGWQIALFVQSSIYLMFFFFLTPIYTLLPAYVKLSGTASMAFVLGTATGASRFLADSVCGDVIDHDESQSDQPKGGSYFAMWLFVSKVAGGFVSLVSGLMLEAAHFRPNVAQQSFTVELAITLMYAVPPAFGTLAAALVLGNFLRPTSDPKQPNCSCSCLLWTVSEDNPLLKSLL
ncbi:hypothetical protein AB1Y20_020478 [Prymnesium parvum]|uniref:Uncharacterized protein n=1 Tax=Prymnesium parvum TaxID=97485 RepID=A0AB34JY73_PRYPA